MAIAISKSVRARCQPFAKNSGGSTESSSSLTSGRCSGSCWLGAGCLSRRACGTPRTSLGLGGPRELQQPHVVARGTPPGVPDLAYAVVLHPREPRRPLIFRTAAGAATRSAYGTIPLHSP